MKTINSSFAPKTANPSKLSPLIRAKFNRLSRTTLAISTLFMLLNSQPAAAQTQSEARNKIAQLESKFQAHFTRELEGPANLLRIVVSSRDEKSQAPGTIVDPIRGVAVTTGDFQVGTAKTAIITTTSGEKLSCKILGISREDHLIVLQFDPGSLSGMEQVKILTENQAPGAFVAGYSKTNGIQIGAVTSETRSAKKVFVAHEAEALKAHWKRLNLNVSEKRSGFPAVFETDLDLDANDCGGPVFASDGSLVGVVISRAGHHATLVVPVSRIQQLLSKR